jgi:F-type H+-transporting ATPase subunit b
MDALLDSLGKLLIQALPTFILLILFHFYLRWMFYSPLDRILNERFDLTEGARQVAAESMARAEQKTAEYKAALKAARLELLDEMEAARKRLQSDQDTAIAKARHEADTMVKAAKATLAEEAAEAKQTLAAESEALAGQIVAALLERKAS